MWFNEPSQSFVCLECMRKRATQAQPASDTTTTKTLILDDVYFSDEHQNFYDVNGNGMGEGFYRMWKNKSHLFPQK